MAKVIYSTHYAAPNGEQYGTVWSQRIAGMFQIKDDEFHSDRWELSSARQLSPDWHYTENDFDFGLVDMIDYDEARYWLHP